MRSIQLLALMGVRREPLDKWMWQCDYAYLIIQHQIDRAFNILVLEALYGE